MLASETADMGTLHEVAGLMQMMNELELQMRVRDAIVEKQKAVYGEESTAYAQSLQPRAKVLLEKGQYDQAIALLRKALAIMRASYGDEHIRIVPTLDTLVHALLSSSNFLGRTQGETVDDWATRCQDYKVR